MQICHYVLWNFLSLNSVVTYIYCDWKNTYTYMWLSLFSYSKVQELLTIMAQDTQLPTAKRKSFFITCWHTDVWVEVSVQLNTLIKNRTLDY